MMNKSLNISTKEEKKKLIFAHTSHVVINNYCYAAYIAVLMGRFCCVNVGCIHGDLSNADNSPQKINDPIKLYPILVIIN